MLRLCLLLRLRLRRLCLLLRSPLLLVHLLLLSLSQLLGESCR